MDKVVVGIFYFLKSKLTLTFCNLYEDEKETNSMGEFAKLFNLGLETIA